MRWREAAMLAIALAACGEVNSDPVDAGVGSFDAPAPTVDAGDPPVADAGTNPEIDASPGQPDAGPGERPDAPSAPICVPRATMCSGGQLSVCGDDGQYGPPTACALGCFTDSSRCWDVAPSAGLGALLDGTSDMPAVALPAGVTIDTNTGAIRTSDGTAIAVPSVLVSQGSGRPQIRVFQVGALTMESATVRGGQLLAIVSHGAIELRGPVSYTLHTGLSRTACAGGNGLDAGGGGGGGRLESGGAGGANRSSPGGAAGQPSAFEEMFALAGGCAGGHYTAYDDDAGQAVEVGYGGTPGGAIHLVSRERIALVAIGDSAGAVNVGGAGGVSGGGGGSGGLVLLEAPVVDLASGAILAANGGGGGGSGGCEGSRGGNGRLGEVAASGGWCIPGAPGGAGGYGVEGSTTAGVTGGAWATGHPNSAGGGGGAAGYIRINTRENGFSRAPGSVISPRHSNGPNNGAIGRR